MEFTQKQDVSKIIQGEFSLRNLTYFIKCTNLCNQIEIYLENDLPLVVKYSVASLGEIKLCLAPLPIYQLIFLYYLAKYINIFTYNYIWLLFIKQIG